MKNNGASDEYFDSDSEFTNNDILPLEIGVSTLISVFARRFLTIVFGAMPLILIFISALLFSNYSQYISAVVLGLATIIWSLFAVSLIRRRASPFDKFVKRLFDVVVSLALLIALAPLMVMISILIKISSKGPVMFVQQRIGKDGKQFKLLKFRTMKVDTDPSVHQAYIEALSENEQAKINTLQDQFTRERKLVHDVRITPIGIFLRKMSLDELPQLYNILRGDISLVGPRPLFPQELDTIDKDYFDIFRETRPGMTGLSQINLHYYESAHEERLRLEKYYVKHWSLWLDVMILAKTFAGAFRSAGAA